jgi:hypothetical protein
MSRAMQQKQATPMTSLAINFNIRENSERSGREGSLPVNS